MTWKDGKHKKLCSFFWTTSFFSRSEKRPLYRSFYFVVTTSVHFLRFSFCFCCWFHLIKSTIYPAQKFYFYPYLITPLLFVHLFTINHSELVEYWNVRNLSIISILLLCNAPEIFSFKFETPAFFIRKVGNSFLKISLLQSQCLLVGVRYRQNSFAGKTITSTMHIQSSNSVGESSLWPRKKIANKMC